MGTYNGNRAMNENQPDNCAGQLILFCGLPGTLKTYLSARVSGRLGYGYLPTRSVGEIRQNSGPEVLKKERQTRYETVARAALAALKLGANIIVDGGFMSRESRAPLLDHVNAQKTTIVNCRCDNERARLKRLAVRAMDADDYEHRSAKEILRDDSNGLGATKKNNLENELSEGRVRAILDVDTVGMTTVWRGNPPPELSQKLEDVLNEMLDEYSTSHESHSLDLTVKSHFDELADQYDSSTEWRRDERLLGSLQRTLPKAGSRVLDVGAGTGLASEWYTKQGHYVTGIDISPMMLRKAADRLTLTILGDATNLPFLDEYFDLILIRQCLHYVDPKRLLSSARRTLKNSGLLAISSTVSPESAKTLWQEFKAVTQPLRLRVFTEREIAELVEEHELLVDERISSSLTRTERLSSLEARAIAPSGGWSSFLRNFEKLANKIAPELNFSFDGSAIEYQQHWVTFWATHRSQM
jgi:ubiquinone/menaquinone biosynthesis C-methylase UbiE/predicted kinase